MRIYGIRNSVGIYFYCDVIIIRLTPEDADNRNAHICADVMDAML